VDYVDDTHGVIEGNREKAIPLQARKGHGGARRLRLPEFKTIGT